MVKHQASAFADFGICVATILMTGGDFMANRRVRRFSSSVKRLTTYMLVPCNFYEYKILREREFVTRDDVLFLLGACCGKPVHRPNFLRCLRRF